MSITRGLSIEKAVMKALNLNGRGTYRVVIDLQAGKPPRIRVSSFMTTDQEEELVRMFELSEWKESDA